MPNFETPQAINPAPILKEPDPKLASLARSIHALYQEAAEQDDMEPDNQDEDEQLIKLAYQEAMNEPDIMADSQNEDEQLFDEADQEVLKQSDLDIDNQDDDGPSLQEAHPDVMDQPDLTHLNLSENNDILDQKLIEEQILNEQMLDENLIDDKPMNSSPLVNNPLLDDAPINIQPDNQAIANPDKTLTLIKTTLDNGKPLTNAFVGSIANAIVQRDQGQKELVESIASMDGGMKLLDAIVNSSNSTDLIKQILTHVYDFKERNERPDYPDSPSIISKAQFWKKPEKKQIPSKAAPIESTWDATDLKRLWRTFRKVPKSHIRGAVGGLRLNKKAMGGDFGGSSSTMRISSYSRLRNVGTFESRLRGQRKAMMGSKWLMKNSVYSNRIKSKSWLDAVVLHEVGHAVDAALGVMNRFETRPECGAWEHHGGPRDLVAGLLRHWQNTPPNVAANHPTVTAALTARQLADNAWDAESQRQLEAKGRVDQNHHLRAAKIARFKEHKEALDLETSRPYEQLTGFPGGDALEKFLGLLSEGSGPEVALDATIKAYPERFQGSTREAYLEAAQEHPLAKVVIDGYEFLGWNRTRNHLRELGAQFGGRAFHRIDDTGKWVSYDIDAKNHGVSHYQFRAPGEWFAELYSHYYMGTLSSNDPKQATHPLFEWFDQHIAKELVNLSLADLPQFDNAALPEVAPDPSSEKLQAAANT